MRIENQTLVHFRHFRHFSSLLTIFPSTTVESALQNHLFMQNKPNFQKSQINVSTVITMNYEQRTTNYEIKNKPNSKPIQTQFKANTNPIQSQFKPKQTQFRPADAPVAESIQLEQLCEDWLGDPENRTVPGPFWKMNLIGNILPVFQVAGFHCPILTFSVLIKIDKPRAVYLDSRWPLGPIVTRNGLRCRPVWPFGFSANSYPDILFRRMSSLILDKHNVTPVVLATSSIVMRYYHEGRV